MRGDRRSRAPGTMRSHQERYERMSWFPFDQKLCLTLPSILPRLGCRYFDGHAASVAGRQESGSEASQLEAGPACVSAIGAVGAAEQDAEDIFVTREGPLARSDVARNDTSGSASRGPLRVGQWKQPHSKAWAAAAWVVGHRLVLCARGSCCTHGHMHMCQVCYLSTAPCAM